MAEVRLNSTKAKIKMNKPTFSELYDNVCKLLDWDDFERMVRMKLMVEIVDRNSKQPIETENDLIRAFEASQHPSFQLVWKSSPRSFANSNVRVVRNALVAMIGISEYNEETGWCKLAKVQEKDMANFKDMFENKLKYDFVCNQTPNMTKTDIHEFFEKLIKDKELQENKNSYDALIVILCGHGDDEDVLVTSDGRFTYIDSIRHRFDCYQMESLKNCPKIFIVDACRGKDAPKRSAFPMRGSHAMKNTITVQYVDTMMMGF
ncbi:caspase-3 [Reticulomyxa filosa]|uniref:Caspase-3 n=1 Tax=Reticulomyxa filosa TaxID=46433 RepID=X6N3A3_RETFI|nr:caspase-3 [Reticulomyxa filosa]|eukprot:ETO20358.1 caspase-3 [Reticulomyxa filosa]